MLLAGALAVIGGCMTSCKDFLTVEPTNQIAEEMFWTDEADLEGVRAGAYEKLSQSTVTSRILYWGELRADNLQQNDMTETDITYLLSATLMPSESMFDWSYFYTGINYCNLVLEEGDVMTEPGNEIDPGFTQSDWNPVKAEMLALRALYYFYLVRAYRDVPFVTTSVRSDTEATSEAPSQVPGVVILGDLIDQLEEYVDNAPTNFGTTAENKGRFTKTGIHALLADMYLWRGALLNDFVNKTNSTYVNSSDIALVEVAEDGDSTTTYTTADGTTIDATYCDALSLTCYEQAIEHATWVIDYMKAEYDDEIEDDLQATDDEKNQPYPLILNQASTMSTDDESYNSIIGTGNSDESIFEIQYDGSTTYNSTVTTYLSSYSSSTLSSGYMAANTTLYGTMASVDPSIGFGKTDIRLNETLDVNSTSSRKPITKFVARSISIGDWEDVTDEKNTPNYSYRTTSDVHWQVYRLSDVMLIKAEAIARLGDNATTDEIEEGYQLCNQIFKRNNPALVGYDDSNASSVDSELLSYRVDDQSDDTSSNYYTYYSTFDADDLLLLVYNERQREFVGEGKRWFDIVRQVEAGVDSDNGITVQSTLTDFITLTSSVKNRLSQLYSFYNPIYSDEMDVNENLVQNPVWERYSTK